MKVRSLANFLLYILFVIFDYEIKKYYGLEELQIELLMNLILKILIHLSSFYN